MGTNENNNEIKKEHYMGEQPLPYSYSNFKTTAPADGGPSSFAGYQTSAPVQQPAPITFGSEAQPPLNQYTGPTFQTYYPYMYEPVARKPKEPYSAKKEDGWFALGSMLLGFLFIRWLLISFDWNGLGTGIFTMLFGAIVLVYAKAKRMELSKESWFWFALLQATGITYFIWPLDYLEFYRAIFLFGSAVYWCAALFGTLLENKTSNYIFIDIINSLFVIPFRNFALYFKSVKVFSSPKESHEKSKTWLYILFGLVLCIPALAILLPLLLQADSGNFYIVLKDFSDFLEKLFSDDLAIYFWDFILSIPVFLYLCGLIAGSAHKRYTTQFTKEKTNATAQSLKVIPEVSIYVLMAVVIAFYTLFIVCQIPYFFSAFAGMRPQGYEVYSEYARDGFFQLCTIAAINLAFLIGAHLLTRKQEGKNSLYKIFTVATCFITILLLITAFSKMALYIGAYGLSAKRIITSLFMIFLAIVFAGIIVLQFKKFPIVRFFVLLGSALFCFLLFAGIDDIILRYNMNAYLNGSLSNFDTSAIYSASYSGVRHAADSISLFDKEKQDSIEARIYYRIESAKNAQGTIKDTVTNMLLRNDKELVETYSSINED